MPTRAFETHNELSDAIMGWMGCTTTKTAITETYGDISDWDVSNIDDMSYLFHFYPAWDFEGDISKWNVSNVTNMKQMFAYCTKFQSDLSKWDVSKVTNMEAMFFNCRRFNSDLTKWKSKWNTSNVTKPENMFHGSAFMYSINGYRWFNEKPQLNWHMVRQAVLKRAIVIYWLDVSSRTACAEGGVARQRDKEEFEEEFLSLM